MRVLVSGGTGFLGRALVRRIIKAGHKARVLTRDAQAAEGRLPAEAEARTWHAPAPVPASTLQGVDAVFHCMGENVGAFPWTAARKAAFRESRVDATRALVDSLAALPPEARPRTLVMSSASGYYGAGGEAWQRQEDPPGPGYLAALVRDWEAEALKAEAIGVRTVCLRLAVVLGDGGALDKLLLPFRLGLGAVIGSGRQPFGWVHRADAAEAFLFALDNPDARGPINVCAPDAVTNRGFSKALARSLKRPLLFKVPAFALSAALGEMARETVLIGQKPSSDKLNSLGYRFRYPSLEGALGEILGKDKKK
jgi:uncharacterized protein (TIGR01777 family)